MSVKNVFLMKRILFCILTIALISSVSLNAGKHKFVADITIQSKDDYFTDYQIQKIAYTESFLFNKLLGNENPETVINLEVNERAKSVKFELNKNEKSLAIFLNFGLISGRDNSFRKDLLGYMLLSEYPQSNDSIRKSWIFHGCWSFIRKNFDKNPKEKESFPFAKMLFSDGWHLSAEAIMNFDAKCGDGFFEMYYSEASELLILVIMEFQYGRNILKEYMSKASLYPVNRYAFFVSLLEKYGYNGKQLDEALNLKIGDISLADEQYSLQIKHEIKEYLHGVEKEKILLGKRYEIYFSVLEKHNELLNRVWPELNAFLDDEYPIKF